MVTAISATLSVVPAAHTEVSFKSFTLSCEDGVLNAYAYSSIGLPAFKPGEKVELDFGMDDI